MEESRQEEECPAGGDVKTNPENAAVFTTEHEIDAPSVGAAAEKPDIIPPDIAPVAAKSEVDEFDAIVARFDELFLAVMAAFFHVFTEGICLFFRLSCRKMQRRLDLLWLSEST